MHPQNVRMSANSPFGPFAEKGGKRLDQPVDPYRPKVFSIGQSDSGFPKDMAMLCINDVIERRGFFFFARERGPTPTGSSTANKDAPRKIAFLQESPFGMHLFVFWKCRRK